MEKVNRRQFLKKAAYVAPAIVVLGSLATPASATVASSSLGGNVIYPDGTQTDGSLASQQQLADKLFN